MEQTSLTSLRILPVSETAHRLKIGRSTLYNWLNPKSKSYNALFPKPVRLGSSVGFIEHEIDQFILDLMSAREGSGVSGR